MKAREFRDLYAIKRGYVDWSDLWDGQNMSSVNKLETKIMELYARYRSLYFPNRNQNK